MKKCSLFFFLLLGVLSLNAYAAKFSLESSAFKLNSAIPDQYTCNGTNISPPLTWTDVPAKTKSLALVVDDPDAAGGTWTHWVLFNIPPTVSSLDTGADVPEGASVGNNSWNSKGYRGPCPPLGAHRYVFTLYAVDKIVELGNGVSSDLLLQAITGHVIEKAQWAGIYQKL